MLVGCGAGQVQNGDLTANQDVESAKEDSARKKSHPEFYKCDVDADCVAVEKAGCCPNGFLVAVNKDEVKAYDAKYACTTPPQTCPLFVVHDTRVAQCDFQAHACKMIDLVPAQQRDERARRVAGVPDCIDRRLFRRICGRKRRGSAG